MKTIAPALFALTTLAAAPDGATDRAQIEAVVREAYVQGVHANPDPEAMRNGFHPDFRMLILREGSLRAITLDEWAARIESAAASRAAESEAPEVRADFTHVDLTGDAATVRLELHRGGRHAFTDYLSLYRAFPRVGGSSPRPSRLTEPRRDQAALAQYRKGSTGVSIRYG